MSAAVERVAKPKRVARVKASGKPIPAWALATMSGDITAEWKLRGGEWLADPRAERPAVVALDVAARGAAFWLGAILMPGGDGRGVELDGTSQESWSKCLTTMFAWAAHPKTGPPLVVVEDTNVGFAKVTPIAALAGARYVGGVVALASAAGLPVLRVPAQTWPLAMLTPDRKRLSRADGKAASRALATSHFGAAITSEDVADAACLALWARGGRP